MPNTATRQGAGVVLAGPVDPFYGIRTTRLVTLSPNLPEMTIRTTYEKVSGPPVKVAIWTITQLQDPVGVFFSPAPSAPWPVGYNKQSETVPPSLKRQDQVFSLTRDPATAFKIGSLSPFLVWIGEKQALKIGNPVLQNADYPDQGSNAEVYTNPNPLPYVELEMLGPLHELRVGDKITETRAYTLFHRQSPDALSDARTILNLKPGGSSH